MATNACHDYLRQESPARARLKNNLRDLLSRDPGFALWKVDEDWFPGFAKESSNKNITSARQQFEIEARLDNFQSQAFADQDFKQLPLTHLVAELFQWLLPTAMSIKSDNNLWNEHKQLSSAAEHLVSTSFQVPAVAVAIVILFPLPTLIAFINMASTERKVRPEKQRIVDDFKGEAKRRRNHARFRKNFDTK